MDDFNIEKVYEVKPISDVDSKREFIKKRKKKVKEETPPIQKLEKEKTEEGHIDIYVWKTIKNLYKTATCDLKVHVHAQYLKSV